jgi:hypothetical protein
VADSAIPGFLVVVSCGKEKIWKRRPHLGPTPARDAYTSSKFKASRRYADRFAERWLILSAKYGLIEPEFLIPENYNRSFYHPDAVGIPELRQQVATKRLHTFKTVGVLGSDVYWQRVTAAFDGSSVELRHINGNLGFDPLFLRLVRDLIAKNIPFREDLPS